MGAKLAVNYHCGLWTEKPFGTEVLLSISPLECHACTLPYVRAFGASPILFIFRTIFIIELSFYRQNW